MILSVILVNYNVKHFLALAIHSAQAALRNIPSEIIVVDNASKEEAKDYITQQFPDIHWIGNTQNVGFSKANNQAIKIAKGKYVLLLNPDTIVSEHTFEKCVEYLNTHETVGALGIRMIDGSGQFLPESKRGFPSPLVSFFKAFGFSALFPKSKLFAQYHLGYLLNSETHTVDILSGAFMCMRKTALEKAGLLDETFFMYGEDIDLSYRIQLAGFENVYFAEDTIIHFKGESTKRGSLKFVKSFYGAMVIFARKHLSSNQKLIFSLLIWPAIWLRATISLGNSTFNRFKRVAFDFTSIFGIYLLTTFYWANRVKYTPSIYPDFFLYGVLPAYTIWILICMFWNGAYDKHTNSSYSIRGQIYGLISLAVLYSLLPEEFRYSRGILLFGGALGIGFQSLTHIIRSHSFQNLSLSGPGNQGILIVGDKVTFQAVSKILSKFSLATDIIGRVQTEREVCVDAFANQSELEAICNQLRPKSVILCAGSLSYSEIIEKIGSLSSSTNVSIALYDYSAIVSSGSKHSNGTITALPSPQILQARKLRQKRILNCVGALILIVLRPFLSRDSKRHIRLQDLFSVLMLKLHLVEIPEVIEWNIQKQAGILTISNQLAEKPTHLANQLYIKNYSIQMDIYCVYTFLLKHFVNKK